MDEYRPGFMFALLCAQLTALGACLLLTIYVMLHAFGVV